MDAQALELALIIPRLPRLRARRRAEPRAIPAPPGPAPDPDGIAATQPWLHVYTAGSIILGLGALTWTTLQVPIRPAIDTGLAGTALGGPDGGLLLWIALGFIGSLRVLPIPGSSGVWTFHFPFIAAAMVLGGPTAGAWVGLLSSLERRELESQPWYGALANHAVLAFAAVLGGLAVEVVRGSLVAAGTDAGAAGLVSTVTGTIILALITSGMAAGTIMLRDRLSAGEMLDIVIRSLGRMTVAEIGIAWVLVVAYTAGGWWAPLLVAIAVLVVWPEEGEVDFLDPLMRILRLRPFERAVDGVLARSRRGLATGGLFVSLDLDGFGAINREVGYQAANELLQEVGVRLRALVRASDLLGRVGGDEIAIFFAGVVDLATARQVIARLQESVGRPVATSYGILQVDVSVGAVLVPPSPVIPSQRVIKQWADQAMQTAKHAHRENPDVPNVGFHHGGPTVGAVSSPDARRPRSGRPVEPRMAVALAAAGALVLTLGMAFLQVLGLHV